jgi:hypothetical protein
MLVGKVGFWGIGKISFDARPHLFVGKISLTLALILTFSTGNVSSLRPSSAFGTFSRSRGRRTAGRRDSGDASRLFKDPLANPALDISKTLRAFSPSPWGEGWDEGEQNLCASQICLFRIYF